MERSVIVLAALAVFAAGCADKPSKARLTPEEVEQICVYRVSCSHEMFSTSSETVSECVSDLMWLGVADYSYDDVISCMMDAGSDCDALFRCGNEGHPPETCDPLTYEDRCDGSVIVRCAGGLTNYLDCHRLDVIYGDTTCVIDPDTGAPDCASTRTCGTETTTACDGNVLELCAGGNFMRIDCGLAGASCRQYSPGFYYCIGDGDGCTAAEGSAWCEGTAIVRCLGGREGSFDCAFRLGSEFTCVPDGTDDAECAPASTACDGETSTDTCDGTAIEYCRWGRADTVDCASLGYAECVEVAPAAFCE